MKAGLLAQIKTRDITLIKKPCEVLSPRRGHFDPHAHGLYHKNWMVEIEDN